MVIDDIGERITLMMASVSLCRVLLTCKIQTNYSASTVSIGALQAQKNMKDLNHVNWQCFVMHISILSAGRCVKKPLPDLECIEINLVLTWIKHDSKRCKKLYQPTIDLKVNLYSCVATNKLGEVKVVTLSETNTRNLRMRPDENEKAAAIIAAVKSAKK